MVRVGERVRGERGREGAHMKSSVRGERKGEGRGRVSVEFRERVKLCHISVGKG